MKNLYSKTFVVAVFVSITVSCGYKVYEYAIRSLDSINIKLNAMDDLGNGNP